MKAKLGEVLTLALSLALLFGARAFCSLDPSIFICHTWALNWMLLKSPASSMVQGTGSIAPSEGGGEAELCHPVYGMGR